jgi:hypothetical protein
LAYTIAALVGKAFAGKLDRFDREFPDERQPINPETVKQDKANFAALSKALDHMDKQKKQNG